MDFKQIESSEDIECLMKKLLRFHDSCIKEIRYISGGYVSEEKTMHPFNSKRIVYMLIQSQHSEIPVIELQFNLIDKLNLKPKFGDYDCVIYEASLIKKNDLFYWSERAGFDTQDADNDNITWISAKELSWRPLENALGERELYQYHR
jgi:hypothetical protein